MTLCEKCIHEEVCNIRDCHDADDERALVQCSAFKNKADFVEVVRCGECEYANILYSCGRYMCKKGCGATKSENDFCSYGERKEK